MSATPVCLCTETTCVNTIHTHTIYTRHTHYTRHTLYTHTHMHYTHTHTSLLGCQTEWLTTGTKWEHCLHTVFTRISGKCLLSSKSLLIPGVLGTLGGESYQLSGNWTLVLQIARRHLRIQPKNALQTPIKRYYFILKGGVCPDEPPDYSLFVRKQLFERISDETLLIWFLSLIC